MKSTALPAILMVIHTHWSRNLGAPRVQLELGEELVRLGCRVAKFSYEDAFPDWQMASPGRLGRLMGTLKANRSFARRAIAYVRRNCAAFDVIDANQTDIPVDKATLGFRGLLVTRSVGLLPEYEAFERWAATRWPSHRGPRELLHRVLSLPARRRRARDFRRSLDHADLINVSNTNDLVTVRDVMGFGDRVVYFPFGMTDQRLRAFGEESLGSENRLLKRTVAFIGTWNLRKGAGDWPTVLAKLQRDIPDVQLLLLGTGISEAAVRACFAFEQQAALTIVPHYKAEDLPVLLSGATVGAFPGYLEGFGFAVLEKLAAGLPTVAYDSPGPRDILGQSEGGALVPRGDSAALCDSLVRWMRCGLSAYSKASESARARAALFTWERIARSTLQCYRHRLGEMGL